MRSTRQRSAILAALHKAERPLSAAEVLHFARTEVPGLGLATVYRTIDSLAERKEIIAVEIPGKPPRYELAGKEHHHHFLCRACHRVYEVEGCPGNFDAFVPEGFELEGHEITLYGRCDACRRPASASPSSKRAQGRSAKGRSKKARTR